MKKSLAGILATLLSVSMCATFVQAAPTTNTDNGVVSEAATVTDSESTSGEDYGDFALQYFQTMYMDGCFQPDSAAITVDSSSQEDGILVTGKNSVLAGSKTDLGTVDFGSDQLQRIQIDGLGAVGSRTKVTIYLDDQAVGTITLPVQSAENNWAKVKNINLDVADLQISGKHQVALSYCQYNSKGTAKESGTAQVLLRSIQFVKQTIPVVNINIDESLGTIDAMNGDETHNTRCYGDLTISVPSTYTCSYDASYTGGTYEMEYIKGRGNSTWNASKKPYKIKLENREDLFGMGSCKHWALIANAYDDTLLHNRFTYAMGEDLDMTYTPQGVPVDVVMNGTYLGSYYLCETVTVDSQRVDIDEIEEGQEDITGDYLLGTGSWGADEGTYIFTTAGGAEFNVNSPDSSAGDYSKENTYIENYMQRVENALMRKANPDTGEVEDPFDLIDLDSAVSYYWIQELSGNGDFFSTGSTYCYKVRDGKLYWGPLWDFDYAWSFYDENYADETDFSAVGRWSNRISWFKWMLTFPEYTDALKAYWKEKMEPELQEVTRDGGMLDQYVEEVEYSAANNFCTNVFNGYSDTEVIPCTTQAQLEAYRSRCNQFKLVLRKRMNWCSQNLDSIVVPNVEVTFVSEGKTYATGIAYGASSLNFPEDPVCSDPDKVFEAWTCTYTDEEGEQHTTEVMEKYLDLSDKATEKDGVYSVTLTARFTDRSSVTSIDQVCFEKSSYRFKLSQDSSTFCQIPYTVLPEDCSPLELTWTVEDESILTLTNTNYFLDFKPKAAGTTKITATTKAGQQYSVTVTIVEGQEESYYGEFDIFSFGLTKKSLSLAAGSTANIQVTDILPENYLDNLDTYSDEFAWFTTDEDVARAHDGVVFAENPGRAVVICRSDMADKMTCCIVTVVPKKAVIASAKVSGTTMTVKMKKKVAATKGSVYQIAYRVKGSAKWTYVSTKNQSKTIKNLKKGTTYQIRVRAVASDTEGSYKGSWSKTKNVTNKK